MKITDTETPLIDIPVQSGAAVPRILHLNPSITATIGFKEYSHFHVSGTMEEE